MNGAPPPRPDARPAVVDETHARRTEADNALFSVMGSTFAPVNTVRLLGAVVDIEHGLILPSAAGSYIHGLDVAAIIAAHASSERDLLIRASHWKDEGEAEPPGRFQMWGLGRLLTHYRKDIPPDLFSKLDTLNIRRRTLYHYGHSQGPSGISQSAQAYIEDVGANQFADEYKRLHGRDPGPKELLQTASVALLRRWALAALEAAYAARAWASR